MPGSVDRSSSSERIVRKYKYTKPVVDCNGGFMTLRCGLIHVKRSGSSPQLTPRGAKAKKDLSGFLDGKSEYNAMATQPPLSALS